LEWNEKKKSKMKKIQAYVQVSNGACKTFRRDYVEINNYVDGKVHNNYIQEKKLNNFLVR